MADDILTRFTGRRIDDPLPLETEGLEEFGAFGALRGLRERAVMLELRRKTGEVRALGYAWLESAEFDPAGVIVLRILGREHRLFGRNLNRELRPGLRLFECLVRHRVVWVREADRVDDLTAGPDRPVIERIEW
jgi:hypothetical protein